nr:histone deacetylase 14 [Tanacetum cinerariifolium]
MADMNINAPASQAPAMAPPIRTDDQILARIRWVPIRKSNCYLDLAFTASSTIPSIYIQQFWDTIQYDKKAGCYRCQLDEQWFVLTKYTLREALQITPINNNQAFVPPPSSDALINFVNELDTLRKKKATLIVIPSIRFTKLIIHHLQRRHRFHPKPNSPLHLPNEEPVLGYLKFSAKGTKREVFRMPIPGSLISAYIQEASYYREYLAKEKKRKQAIETFDKPSKAKKSKYGFVGKKRSLKFMAESVAEDAPAKEPQVTVEYADLQKALEESMKSMYDAPRGLLPPMVIREPESRKYQPLPEPKKKSHADQYIFQRLTFTPTGSSGHDEPSYVELGQSESEESEKVVPGADEGGQGEGKGQAGPDPAWAGPDPGNAGAKVQSILSPVVHAGSDHEHMDLDAADVSPQPSTEQLDEGFTATAYSKVQENLKLIVEEQVLLEDPASSLGTLSSL